MGHKNAAEAPGIPSFLKNTKIPGRSRGFCLCFCKYVAHKHPLKRGFLMIWARDFDSDEGMEIPEYFVYFGIFIVHSRDERFAQDAKGEFLDAPLN